MRKILLVLSGLFAISCIKKNSIQNTIQQSVEKDSVVVKTHKVSDSSTIENKSEIKIVEEEKGNREVNAEENQDKNTGEADAAFQWEANQKLEKLLKHFGKNIPGYYGGAFINDSGDLEINLFGDTAKGKREIIKIIGSENVHFNTQKYSYNELNKLMTFLNDFAQNPANKKYAENMSFWGVMEKEGYVQMGLLDNSPEKIKEFKAHIHNSPAIKFVKSSGIILQ